MDKKSINVEKAPLFSLFWENSKFNRHTQRQLEKRLQVDAESVRVIPQLFYSSDETVLFAPDDALSALNKKRESGRDFSEKPLSMKQLGSLFSSFGAKSADRRFIPSAGAKYPVEVFAFLLNVKGPLNRKAVYYNPDNHSLSVIAACCGWDELSVECGLFVDVAPAVLFVFAGFAERVIHKYGERGGRFFLIEVGHYAQSLSLRIAEQGLAGVEAGGLYDNRIKERLGLEGTGALIALGAACGNPS